MKSPLKDLLRHASRPPERSTITFYKIVVIVILAAAVAWSFYMKTDMREKIAAIEDAEAELQEYHDRLEALQAEYDHVVAMQLIAERFPIENLSVRNIDGELIVSGRIRNAGRRNAGDIELTAYCLDQAAEVVCEQVFTASSSDGKPLGRGQRRPFKHRIANPPPTANDVVILITDISFEDTE